MKTITCIGENKYFIERYLPAHIPVNINVVTEAELIENKSNLRNLIIIESDVSQSIDFQQIKKLKCQYPSCPIILLSNGATEYQLRNAYRARIRDYILLPDDGNYFTTLIEQLINYQKEEEKSREFQIIDIPTNTNMKRLVPKFRTLKAIEFIKKNYQTKLSVKELARMCHMQVSSFSRKFREEHGCTIRDYIKNIRINSAMTLLKKTKLSIENIAFDVGFETVSLFNRLFKQIAGVCPSVYRQTVSNSYF